MCPRVGLSGRDQPLVFLEIVKPSRPLGNGEQANRAWMLRDDVPLDGLLEQHVQHRERVVHGLGCPVPQMVLQVLDVLARDRVQPLRPELRNQVHLEDRFLRRDAARLLTIRPGVSVDESQREVLQRRDFRGCDGLFLLCDGRFGLSMCERLVPRPLAILTPPLGR